VQVEIGLYCPQAFDLVLVLSCLTTITDDLDLGNVSLYLRLIVTHFGLVFAFSALTLLVEWQEGHRPCKN